MPGNRVRRCRTRTRPPHGRHAGQIVSLEASNSLCNCWNAVHPGALHFMTLGTVELQVATIPLRWRLVHRRGTRPCRGPRTCIPAARVAVGKSRCCMECSSPTQAAEIKETLQLLVVRVTYARTRAVAKLHAQRHAPRPALTACAPFALPPCLCHRLVAKKCFPLLEQMCTTK